MEEVENPLSAMLNSALHQGVAIRRGAGFAYFACSMAPGTNFFGFSALPCRYSNTARLAVCVVLLYEAEMVAEVDMRTIDVFNVKVALVLPAGTVTLEGTLAAPLLLESVTCAPPAGAAPLSVTVPVEDCTPPTTLAGFNVSEETVGRGGGITVSEADVLVPP